MVASSGTFALGGPSATQPQAFGIVGIAPAKIINCGSAVILPGVWSQPSSNHPGGAVAAFCDGRTVFLKDSLPARVYAQLLSSNNVGVTSGDAATWRGTYNILSEGDFQ